jgi:hypothetical protein
MSSLVAASNEVRPAFGPCAARAAQLRELHGSMLCLALVVIACSLLFEINDAGRVALRWLPNHPLPELCGSRVLLGVDCPGCGLTRSILALVAGDLAMSFSYHPVGWLLALAVLAQVPYRIFALRELRTRVVERKRLKWFGLSLIGILVVCWLARGAFKTSPNVEPVPVADLSSGR